jgi:hypothetical protein
VAVLTAVTLAGCGSDADGPADAGADVDAGFPATAPLTGDHLTASVEDPTDDTEDAGIDLRRATVEHVGTRLAVRLDLTRPLRARDGVVHLGAYLLRDADDDRPYAARVDVRRATPPRFVWGPWLERGGPAAGTVRGATIAVTVDGVPVGRYRYVQFFAESERGIDVAPDDTPDGVGVVAIEPAGS